MVVFDREGTAEMKGVDFEQRGKVVVQEHDGVRVAVLWA